MTAPALALLEFESIAIGVQAGDAMVKRAPVEMVFAGTVHPGKYVVLVTGDVASVEEAFAAGSEAGLNSLLDTIFLPGVHPQVVSTLRGVRTPTSGEAIGVVETRTVASILGVADRGLKGADVSLLEVRLADRLGGKAFCVFTGRVADVEAAVELAVAGLRAPENLVAQVVIPQVHAEMWANIESASDFYVRLGVTNLGE